MVRKLINWFSGAGTMVLTVGLAAWYAHRTGLADQRAKEDKRRLDQMAEDFKSNMEAVAAARRIRRRARNHTIPPDYFWVKDNDIKEATGDKNVEKK